MKFPQKFNKNKHHPGGTFLKNGRRKRKNPERNKIKKNTIKIFQENSNTKLQNS
jgi:hypothetical protein